MSQEFAFPGSALGERYAVEREIGRGGMARVYLAEDVRHARRVAIKVLRPELAESVGPDRFLREIRTTASLRHPHIVPLYDSGEAEGFLYYVMPYVEGESLEQRLKRETQLGIDEALHIACEVADALGYAHERGLLHRDIKPGNIMLERGHALVTDFGIARAVSTAGGERLTRTGLAIGTPTYMSPEQASGQDRVDARSDLYSLACVLYEMLAGQPPFTGKTSASVMARHALDPVPPLATVRPGLPPHVARAVEKALSKTPADRFASTAEWRAALTSAEAIAAAAPSQVEPGQAGPEPPGRSVRSELAVAVLPIRASPDDVDAQALAEGLTEDITAGLTRFTYLDVIGGVTGASESNPRLLARELGARYVLTGRIRRAGRTVRVGMKLIDTESGTHPWAESYDASLDTSSLFDVQDHLTDRIVATVADQQGVLIRSMIAAARDKPIEQMTSRDAVFLMFDYYHGITPELHLKCRDALERAVEIEPDSADAWACLSQIYCEEHKHDFNVRPDPLERALTAGRRAAYLDNTCNHAYYALAEAHFFRRDLGRFRTAAERAVELNPWDGNVVAFMGILHGYAGDLDKGTALIRRVLELNPQYPRWYLFGIWYAHFAREEYEEALATAQRISMPNYYPTHAVVAMSAGMLGRLDVGREAIRELLAMYPEFAERGYSELSKWVPDTEVLDRYFIGLRKAGLDVADAPGAAPAPAPDSEVLPSIAVLAFADLSPEGDQEYFCDGMCEEILNALAKVKALRVASRISSFSFKESGSDTRTIGKQLGVGHLLEGSVRKSGERLRITAQLIRVDDDSHLWSESYDRTLDDVFAIQEDIGHKIVQALRVALTPGESKALAAAPTAHAEAYDYYLRGREFFYRSSRRDHEHAREMFLRAIEIDPSFARAYAGLADTICFVVKHFERSTDLLADADEASRKALDLDPGSAEAHTSRGVVHWLHERYDEADQEFETAIALDPDLFEAYWLYGLSCFNRGKREEAVLLMEKAELARPEDYQAPLVAAPLYQALGREREARQASRRGVELASRHLDLNPDDARAWYLGAGGLVKLGQVDDGLEWADRAARMDPENPLVFYNLAEVYSSAGRIEEAIDHLERAVALGYAHKEGIRNDPDFAPLKGHPRYEALLN